MANFNFDTITAAEALAAARRAQAKAPRRR